MATVSIDRRLLYALASVTGLALLAVSFLLGRTIGGRAPAAPSVPGAAAAPVESGATGSSAHVPLQAGVDSAVAELPSPSAPLPRVAALPEPLEHGLPAPTHAPELAPPADDPERAAVAAYLDAVDAIQASGLAGSPESAANEMAVALAQGDGSGLDGLVRETEEARRRLLAISPPATCTAHHRETVASFDDALAMLRALRDASDSTDPSASLSAVVAQATALRTRAEALQREDRRLRERTGQAPRAAVAPSSHLTETNIRPE